MTLDELRKEIDDVDAQLVKLFSRRMDAVKQIAQQKKVGGLAIYSADREKLVVDKAMSHSTPELYYYVSSLFRYIMELSKMLQRELLVESRPLSVVEQYLKNAKTELPTPHVTVQGIKGSFAMAAAQSMYPKAKISYVASWEDVLYAVEDNACDYGVLPVENSAAGSIAEVYDLLIKYKHYIVKAYPLPVDQCLLGIRGATVSDIRNVYSHPAAFPQCEDFLRSHHKMQRFPMVNTAVAAEYVAREGKMEYAAISSRECAHIYGLDILVEAIQQNKANTTRFISVSKRPEIPEKANKISLVFTLPHVTGSLYRTLSRFALSGLNLTKIESRPNPQKNFEYYFYLDFSGSLRSENTLDLLSALSEELPTFCFLGNYNEA